MIDNLSSPIPTHPQPPSQASRSIPEGNQRETFFRSDSMYLAQDIRDRRKKRLCSNVPSIFVILILVTTACSLIYVVTSIEALEARWKGDGSGESHLFLTPYIQAGLLDEGRKLSRANLFPGIISYSGFLTVDGSCKSHIFFWFFPQYSGNTTAPFIVWHGGGPGTSGLFALFEGTGPVTLNDEGTAYTENDYSWTKAHSILYLDSPMGAGFSYTEKGEMCFATSSDDVAENVVEALRQFFQLFPEFQEADLYISSSSYGGKFIPMIGRRIDNENELDKLSGNSNLTSINLKGLISMSGFSDPIHQIDYGEFYFNMGFINEVQMKHFQSEEARAKSYIRSRDYYAAYQIIEPLIVGTAGSSSYLINASGIDHPYNFYEDLENPKASEVMHRLNNYLNLKSVQQAIHVDTSVIGRNYSMTSSHVYRQLTNDIYSSVKDVIEDLLDKGYKFLFTSGQFDLIVPHTTVYKFLNELRWRGGFNFTDAGNYWYEYKGRTIGYGKSTGNLSYIMLRNTGHHPFMEKPEWTQDMVFRFIRNASSLYES